MFIPIVIVLFILVRVAPKHTLAWSDSDVLWSVSIISVFEFSI